MRTVVLLSLFCVPGNTMPFRAWFPWPALIYVPFKTKYHRALARGSLFFILITLPAIANEWPLFHGPKRNNISDEKGLIKKWPDNGPKLLWTAAGCGFGFSGPSVGNGMIYCAGTFDKETYVFAFDLNGQLKWKKLNGGRWEVPKGYEWGSHYDGSRATPTLNDNIVYHLGELGRLTAFDSISGERIWTLDICKEFEAEVPLWGYSEGVLIIGNLLIVSPGGKKCYMAALDKKTGKVVWMSSLKNEPPSNSSPILVEENGIRQIITMTGSSVIGIEADTGILLWKHKHMNEYKENCLTPVYHDNHVFISSGYNMGCELIKLNFEGKKIYASRVWMSKKADFLFGGVIFWNGYIYGAGDYQKGWFCLEWETGKIKWKQKATKDGEITCADGMLYCLSPEGVMRLVEPTPEKWNCVSEFTIAEAKRQPFFAHPVICNGRLYVRHEDNLYCYDLRPE